MCALDHESGWIIEGVILRRYISTEIYPSEVLEGGVLIITTIAVSLLIFRRAQRGLDAGICGSRCLRGDGII